jgi:quercetin dioxygenase-like cupin family protein
MKIRSFFLSGMLALSGAGILHAQGGRGGASVFWAEKTAGGVYTAPNKPLVRLADLKAKHAGQKTWGEVVVQDAWQQAEYKSATRGTRLPRRFHPDTAELLVVVEGQLRVEIEGLEPFVATRGSLVNILRGTMFSWEVTGDQPALWVDINPLNFQTLYAADGPAPAGANMVKVSFNRAPAAYASPNLPHWNLFEAAKAGPPGGPRTQQDHLFASPIYGTAPASTPNTAAFNPASTFGHMHPGMAEWWVVQAGQISGRFENTGEFVGSEGDILYAPPMMWHQMAFQGTEPACRLAIAAFPFINMNSVPNR